MVARQIEADKIGIGGSQFLHDRPGAITRAIVDQHDFMIIAEALVRRGGNPAVQFGQAGFLIVAWDDHR
jgi:hypothetical protein